MARFFTANGNRCGPTMGRRGMPFRPRVIAVCVCWILACTASPEPSPATATTKSSAPAKTTTTKSAKTPMTTTTTEPYARCENGSLQVTSSAMQFEIRDNSSSRRIELSVPALHAWREGDPGDYGDDAHRALLPIAGKETVTLTDASGSRQVPLRSVQLTWPDRDDPYLTVSFGTQDQTVSITAHGCRYAHEQLPRLEALIH